VTVVVVQVPNVKLVTTTIHNLSSHIWRRGKWTVRLRADQPASKLALVRGAVQRAFKVADTTYLDTNCFTHTFIVLH
jgi:hypothetical protein